jgi:hypothetical protein
MFNEGFTRLRIRAGCAAGAPVTVTTVPARTYPTVRVMAQTVIAGESAARGGRGLRVIHDTTALGTVVVDRVIAVGDSGSAPSRARTMALVSQRVCHSSHGGPIR